MITLTLLNGRFFAQNYLAMSPESHTFIALVVSFLLVSRVQIALSRYWTARYSLSDMCRASREIVDNACLFTRENTDDSSKEWRHELAYRSLILLRTTMAVTDFPTTKMPAWSVPELNGNELEDVESAIFVETQLNRFSQTPDAEHSVWQETMRVPICLAYLLRKTVHSQEKRLLYPTSFAHKMHENIDSFIKGYYEMRSFSTTPVPFPLVQMARTFLFLFVFSLPFVVLMDDGSGAIAHYIAVFVMTFGFVGLEFVAIELDDPFGDDPNDFDNE